MVAASLIGFGLVLLGVSALSSLLIHGVLSLARSRLRDLGPWAERSAASGALVLPPLFGLGVSLTIAGTNLVAHAAGTDHCLGHAHHLHLCLVHGAAWLAEPWAVAAIAFFCTYLLVRTGQTAWAHLGAQRAATRLKRTGFAVADFDRAFLVPSDDTYAFTAGILTPSIIVSGAAWESLDANERTALLAHERAHIVHGDLWKRAALGLLACFGVPVLAQRALRLWELASERACDCDATARVGKPSIVAKAILSLARSSVRAQGPAVAVFAATCHVTDRVQSLFRHREDGRPAARRLVAGFVATALVAATTCLCFAESLHHVLETILG